MKNLKNLILTFAIMLVHISISNITSAAGNNELSLRDSANTNILSSLQSSGDPEVIGCLAGCIFKLGIDAGRAEDELENSLAQCYQESDERLGELNPLPVECENKVGPGLFLCLNNFCQDENQDLQICRDFDEANADTSICTNSAYENYRNSMDQAQRNFERCSLRCTLNSDREPTTTSNPQ